MSEFFDGFTAGRRRGRSYGNPSAPDPGGEGSGFRDPRRGPPAFAKFEDFGGPGWGGHGPGHMHAHGHARGGPPWRPGRRMRRGDIRLALLLELLDGAAHGYELIGRLEARTGGMWRPSAGSVYPTLQLLEDEGLVSSRDEAGKRVFELTDEGRTEATAARERSGQTGPWAATPSGPHFDLRRAMKALVLATRQVAVAGDERQVAAAVAVITEARQRIYRLLAGDEDAPAGAGPDAAGGDEGTQPAG